MSEETPRPPESPAPEPSSAPPAAVEVEPAPLPAPARRWSKLQITLLGIGALAVALLLFVVASGVLEYAESTDFCSRCHVMKPEVVAHDSSPHARTDCGQCHIGPGIVAKLSAKMQNVRYLYVYPLKLYEKPIPSPIKSLRPVEQVCEQCHWPQKFYDDRVAILSDYATNQTNSLTRTQLLLHTGGGAQTAGLGRGIHWHIENPVYYIASDDKRQDIVWVQASYAGVTTEYVAASAQLTPDFIAKAPKRKMDCVDCHNRATHVFETPDDALNEAMASGLIPADLPFIKQQGLSVLSKSYGTEAEAAKAIAAVGDYYRTSYADIYATREADVKAAVSGLQKIFDTIQFPFMNANWQSHSNNIGHLDFPGCFRCHDGLHLSSDKQSIRLECNLCHTIPQVAGPGKVLPPLQLASAIKEPTSHKSTTWLAEHRYQFDATCVTCHTTDNPGGADNTSFCSNSACHGTNWKYAGLDAPQIRALVAPPKGPGVGGARPIPHPVSATTNCLVCHDLDKVRPFPDNHITYKINQCTGCHKAPAAETAPAAGPTAAPAAVTPAAAPTATPAASASPTAAPATGGGAPAIPHTLVGRSDCLLCHGATGVKPEPADHAGRTNDTCQACHKPAP